MSSRSAKLRPSASSLMLLRDGSCLLLNCRHPVDDDGDRRDVGLLRSGVHQESHAVLRDGVDQVLVVQRVAIRRASDTGMGPRRNWLRSVSPSMNSVGDEVSSTVGINVVDGNDVRVIEPGNRASFPGEPLKPIIDSWCTARAELQRYFALELRVMGEIDFTHSARADQGSDVIAIQSIAGFERRASLARSSGRWVVVIFSLEQPECPTRPRAC